MELVKFKVTAPGVTDGGGDVEIGEIIEIPPRSAKNLARISKGEIIETQTEPENPEKTEKPEEPEEDAGGESDDGNDITDDPEVKEYQKTYDALDKHTRDNLYAAAKEKVDIGYDINKDPLIKAIIEAGKAKVILDALATE